MGVTITIDKNLEKFISNTEKRLIKNLQETVDNCKPEVTKQTLDLVDKKLHYFFETAITRFYSTYSPYYYDRRGTMNNIFFTERDGSLLRFWFDSDLMPYRDGSVGDLYDTVFVHGYHGGASSGDGHPNPGTPYYRKPVGEWSQWGRPALQAPISPLDHFNMMKEDYEKRGFKRDLRNIWITQLRKAGLDIG